MFSGNFRDDKDGQVTIDDFEPPIVESLVDYMYTGKIPESANFQKLLRLADKFGILPLAEHCIEQCVRNITIENCCELLLAIKQFHLLKRKACAKVVKFIYENQAAVQTRDDFEKVQKHNDLLLLLFSWREPVCRKRKFS